MSKRDLVVKINETAFTSIELIKKTKEKIIKEYFTVNEFFKKANKIDKNLEVLINNLVTKKNNFLDNNKFFKNKKNIIFSIMNVTPDSFSDGGDNFQLENSLVAAKKMIDDGADIIDVGGESTRPGADKVEPADEALRVLPIIQRLNNKNIKLSLDTRNSSTMELGLLNGVNIINDVSALKNDLRNVEIVKKYNVPIILMHMPGTPQTMMKNNKYRNVVLDVYDFLEERINYCEANGIKRKNIIVDPGIGFGKDFKQNIDILNNLSIFHTLNCSIMLGISRKRFISSISKEDIPKMRVGGTISATIFALMQGIRIHRVHDIKQVNQAIKVFEKLNSK
ncbi:MAG: dihydropteroate synthase [Pseudomonadota bacterium]|nr:dihydropteroate synthase [Pseudomonadota bacterium]